jgi:hypothetical protein
MAVEYTKADEVWPGKRLSSRDYNKLALAFNDRLKQGVADPSWRLFWYAHSLFRGMRNPDNNGNNWAAEDEWWKFYSHIPKDSDVFWPANGPGEGKGINVSNPMGAFIYGSEPGIDSEAGRLNPSAIFDGVESTDDPPTGIPLYLNVGGTPTAPASNSDYWILAKHQRGAWNPSLNRNFKTAVAMAAAQEHGKIDYAPSQYYLKGYGGFHVVPRVNYNSPVCQDGYTPNYILKFESLVNGVSSKLFGTCPEDPADVYMYWEGFASYNLLKFDGTVESLPLADWKEGPYETEAYLQRVKGQQLNQTLNFFAKEFKGTTSEQENSDIVAERAFPFQDFLTSQYPLAPAYGTVASGNITAQYKSFTKNGPHESGRTFDVGSATSYQIHDTFCFAGFYATVSGSFSEEILIDVIADGDTLTTFKLSQGTDHLQYFKHPRQECLVEFKTASFLPSGANVTIEIAELLTYRPGVYDAYVVTRLASCITVSGNHDKRGETFGSAKAAGRNLLDIGCIANLSSNIGGVDSEDQINTNPVYEAGRQMVHDNLRLAERHLLVGYEVTGGKSVLYFNRYARGMNNKDLDVFRGIAAPTDAVASGNLVYGETYQVVSDEVNYGVIYNGVTYYNGGTFTADYEKDFIVSPSDADPVAFVVPKNGIRSTPLRDDKNDRFRGQTNEWQMFVSTNVYKDSDDSIYKPEAFADILGFLNDRCTFLSDSWRHSESKASEIRRHVTYNQKPIMRPENPPGYRHLLGTHWTGDSYFPGWNSLIQSQNTITSDCQNAASSTNCAGVINHLKSCQLYKADYEIESVERNGATGVKVTLKGRLENENAPSSIVNSQSSSGSSEGWNAAVTGVYVPNRRTDENAVLEYLNYATSGHHCTKRVGDVSIDAGVGSGFYSNDFNGNCLPRFYFSRNIRHVWNDKPDTHSTSDTPVFSDELLYMEFILQAICGGFVDMESTLKLTCTHQSRLYDYTFPNLCEQALRTSKYKKYWKSGATVTKDGTTLSWAAQEGLIYDVYGHDISSDTSTKIAIGVTPTITTSTNYDYYFVLAYSYQTTEILDYTVTDTDGGGHTINFTTSDEKRVFYYLRGRANSSSAWAYWTGSAWSTDRANALDADPPVTLSSSNKKAQYRIEADYYGSKRWMEFLPADIREDNAQGFGPFPNTNLYARIFNNLVNAVNKLQRARIELPVTFEFRHSAVTYLGTEKGDSGIDTDNHPLACSEGATNLAALANFGTITQEATGSYGGSAISDRALITDPTDWDTGTSIDSVYQIDLGGPFGLEGTASEGLGCNGTNIKGALVANSGNIYLISSGYKGEIRIADDPLKYALPTTIRDQFTAAPGLLGITQHTYQKHVIDATNGTLGTTGASSSPVTYTTNKYRAITGAIDECHIYEGGFVLDAANNPFYDEFKSASAFSYDQRSVSSTNYFAGHGNHVTSVFTPMTSKPMWIKIDLIERDYSFNE